MRWNERLTTVDLSLANADEPTERFGRRHNRTVNQRSVFDIGIFTVRSCPVSVSVSLSLSVSSSSTEFVNGSVDTITPAPYRV